METDTVSLIHTSQYGKFYYISDISPKDKEDLLALDRYYTMDILEKTIVTFNQPNYKISLRTMDYYVVHFIRYNNPELWKEYIRALSAHKRCRFDPFRRRSLLNTPYIQFIYNNNIINTTFGQLFFFQWVHQKNIIPFIEENLKVIQTDMNLMAQRRKDKSHMTTRGVRSYASTAPFTTAHRTPARKRFFSYNKYTTITLNNIIKQ